MVPLFTVMEKTFNFKVLGCRMNHAEQREMESVLRSRGLTPSTDSPDIEVVHTCSVTGQAAAKSRNAIRRARKNGKTVFVTGCFTGTDPDVAQELGDVIVKQEGDIPMIERFAQSVDAYLERPSSEANQRPETISLPIATLPTTKANHVRAELRIQDGCDAHCTFCIIPKIRTTLRSKTIDDVVTEATRLVELGHQEIVFTGVFIGAFGHETALRRKQKTPDAEHLADLFDAVAQVSGLKRLRISSMEPGDVTEPLLDAMVANQPIVVPHLHLPLQSGSDQVLRKMNRQYGIEDYLDMIAMTKDRLTIDGMPPAITTDIICGFPTETDEDFAQTVKVAKNVGYLHIHVFPYSVRTGTAAARWKQLPTEVVRKRVNQLLELDEMLSLSYRNQLLGKQVEVMLEQDVGDDSWKGRCEHYAEVTLKTSGDKGALVSAKVTEVTQESTLAIPTLQII